MESMFSVQGTRGYDGFLMEFDKRLSNLARPCDGPLCGRPATHGCVT